VQFLAQPFNFGIIRSRSFTRHLICQIPVCVLYYSSQERTAAFAIASAEHGRSQKHSFVQDISVVEAGKGGL
jgi:hypothetical protein